MRQSRAVHGILGLVGFSLVMLAFGWFGQRESSGHPDPDPSTAIPVAANSVQLRLELGLKDSEQVPWDGELIVSEGRVLELQLLQGAKNSTVDGSRFKVRAMQAAAAAKNQKKKKQNQSNLVPAILRARLDAPSSAKVTVKSSRGEFTFALADLALGQTKTFVDGQVSVSREDAAVRLTGSSTEDDFPVLTRTQDGSVWLAYVEYKLAGPIIIEQVQERRFDSLEPKDHGDRIRLRRFDGKTWQPPIDVTDRGLDVWRPTIAVDGGGNVVVAWAEKKDDDWNIFSRKYSPAKQAGAAGTWSDVVQVTREPGSDFHVVSTTDSHGKVWLAWQGCRNGKFAIQATIVDHPTVGIKTLGEPDTNNWGPSLAADSNGNVYLAFDYYSATGGYDVRVFRLGENSISQLATFDSPRFEARPVIVCDGNDRLWIAYELGDVNWGKDFVGNDPAKIGLKTNPAFGLYVNRTIKVRCLMDGKWQTPAADLETALAAKLSRNRSLPRLTIDADGGVWLLLRHHLTAAGGGEVWQSFAMRYDGKSWSVPRGLPHSSNLLDNRPAVAAFGDGILTVYSGDERLRTQDRNQDDLFAAVLHPDGPATPPQLKPDPDRDEPAAAAAVHPNEAEAVARMREFRLDLGGKELRMVRGEFHRHTEYTAHRDQDGTLEDSYRYALDAGNLDWMGNGDHDNGNGHEYMWWQIQKFCDLMHNPPHFTAALTYERSVVFPSGHRNVMFPRRGIRPLPRLGTDKEKELLFGTPEAGAPDIKLLYDYLKHFEGICSIHTSGTNMGTDWRDNDPEVEPVVEIYQGHRHNYERLDAPRAATEPTNIGGFQPSGYINHALDKGYRLGFQASSDHMSTHMSYGCVFVEDVSREGIINGFKKRHCYGATDNILLVVRSGEHLMGDEFSTTQPPTLQIHVHGATPIAKVHVVRNNAYVYTAEPKQEKVELTYSDAEAQPGQTYFYYVRIEQEDGNLAWASPMWITYKASR